MTPTTPAQNSRHDYLHDPAAPSPTTMPPGAGGAVFDEHGRTLLVRREDNGRWSLPGGMIRIDESVADATVREVAEETGLQVKVVSLIGVYSDPQHVVAYTNGELRREFFLLCRCQLVGGALRTDHETLSARFFAPEDAVGLPLTAGQRQRIEDALRDAAGGIVR